MRIAYLLDWPLGWGDGVLRKVRAQLCCWRGLGATVELIRLARPASGQVDELAPFTRKFFGYGNPLSRALAYEAAASFLRAGRFDVLYNRFDKYFPAFERLRPIFEFNSDDLAELQRRPRALAYQKLTRKRLSRRARGVIFVTNELRERERQRRTFDNVPSAVLPNSIDHREIPELAESRPQGPFRLVFVGQAAQAWQGLDVVVRLAELCPDFQFDIVGAESGPQPANLRYHGVLSREAYEPLLRQADVGLGPLALHRKQMEEACPLKVREYLAYGLPVIGAYRDPDLNGQHWFFLQLPNEPNGLEERVPRIRAFVESVRGRRVLRSEIAPMQLLERERHRLDLFAAWRD